MRGRRRRGKSDAVFEKARRVLVGGVNSPIRAFSYAGTSPLLIEKGRGASVYDYDGNEYIDYVLSYGAMILGHSRREVIDGIKDTAGSHGLAFGTTHKLEVELATRLRDAIPLMKKIRLVSSGTEAVMGAIRLARGVTGRDKILKFEGAYHGHADYLLAKAGSGVAALGLPGSSGVPGDFTRNTIVAPQGDRGCLDRIFTKEGRNIAAVIVEPVGANNGVVKPEVVFLEYLRRATGKYKALLIFDEVVTGFRFCFGSVSELLGIKPDIICLGKIIGGGLPIGAYGSSAGIMDHLAPRGDVYQASTFAGNPVVMRAGIETLDILKSLKRDYNILNKKAERVVLALTKSAECRGIDVSVSRFHGIFSVHFGKKEDFRRFYRALLGKGVYFAPSEHEANFLSFAHKDKDIKKTVKAIQQAFNAIAQKNKEKR